MASSRTSTRVSERARERPTFAALVTEVHGTARLGRRTKHLVRRLTPEDVAVIDHADLDRMAAEDLVESGVKAVVNVSTSTSSRYPNPGPLILARAGIPLVDAVDAPLFEKLSDGDPVTVRGSTVIGPDGLLVEGRVLSVAELSNIAREQQHRIGEAIDDFAENTLEHIRDEGDILAGRLEIPELRTEFRDRHALIVVRGTDYRSDLRALRPYIRDLRPVLVGVDGGGDALLEAGLTPDLVIGDMDSASDRVLTSGAELVVHAYQDGTAPGRERLEALGLEHKVLPAPGTSEDVAMLVAFERGAEPDRHRRHPLQPDRVPRQGPRGDVVDVPHPAAGRRDARRHEGSQPALPGGAESPADVPAGARGPGDLCRDRAQLAPDRAAHRPPAG